jgi:hypothetical protein
VVEWKPPPLFFLKGAILKRVRILKPFGIHEVGDVIIVQDFVANFWVQNRMVAETEDKQTAERRTIESANFNYNVRGK